MFPSESMKGQRRRTSPRHRNVDQVDAPKSGIDHSMVATRCGAILKSTRTSSFWWNGSCRCLDRAAPAHQCAGWRPSQSRQPVPRTSSQRLSSLGSIARIVTARRRDMFRYFWRLFSVLTRICVPSKLHHTGWTCGGPLFISVARDTTIRRSRRKTSITFAEPRRT
jgi:hypothetical protein